MKDWFTIDQVDESTYIISEYRHWEETHCYLLIGSKRALLIDTGLGISNIYEQVLKLTDKPVTAVATHIHWDHIGGHKHVPEFYAHEAELDWLNGKFPLPLQAVKNMVTDRCELPEDFCFDGYAIFQGKPGRLLDDGDTIDLGGRSIQVLHTPGHSPGHLCFWEDEKGYLYSGDLVYEGTLFANYPSTDPQSYMTSLEKIAVLPIKRIFPGHHSLNICPELVVKMRDAFRNIFFSRNRLHLLVTTEQIVGRDAIKIRKLTKSINRRRLCAIIPIGHSRLRYADPLGDF